MTLAVLELPSREAAIALAKAIGDGASLPRCDHARWRLKGGALMRHMREVARRGVVRPCVCEVRDRPSPRCPHVTWQAASVLELPDGTVLVQAEPEAVDGRPEPRRALTDEEREALEVVWTLRAERRAEEG